MSVEIVTRPSESLSIVKIDFPSMVMIVEGNSEENAAIGPRTTVRESGGNDPSGRFVTERSQSQEFGGDDS